MLGTHWRPSLLVIAALGLLASSFGARDSSSYTGGPALAKVVGWDEQHQRIYFLEFPPAETGSFYVSYFDLASATPEQDRLAWEEIATTQESPRLKSLRHRAKPLEFWATEVLSGHVEATFRDSVDVPNGRFARYQLEVYYVGAFAGLRFRLVSYSKEFLIKDVYKIPGREDFVFIVSFRGNPHGMFEETQVPVLIRQGTWNQVHEVSWPSHGDFMEPKPVR